MIYVKLTRSAQLQQQVAEDQEVSRRELEEEVHYFQQSSLRFVNTIY